MEAKLQPGNIKDVAQVSQAISGILAPAVMINASALVILALQNKYSQLIDRLRALNDERRDLKHSEQPSEQRLANVVEQIDAILLRAKMVRNSIVSLYVSIMLFVLSSLIIGGRFIDAIKIPISLSLGLFMIAMILVFAGGFFALRDIGHAFTVARLEVRGVEELENK